MKKKRVGIINLNINNIHSIYAACKVAGYKIQVIDDRKNNYNQDLNQHIEEIKLNLIVNKIVFKS